MRRRRRAGGDGILLESQTLFRIASPAPSPNVFSVEIVGNTKEERDMKFFSQLATRFADARISDQPVSFFRADVKNSDTEEKGQRKGAGGQERSAGKRRKRERWGLRLVRYGDSGTVLRYSERRLLKVDIPPRLCNYTTTTTNGVDAN